LIGYEVLRERFQLDGYVHFDLRAFVPSIADVVERVASIGEDRWSFIVKNRDGEHDLCSSDKVEASRQHAIADRDRELGRFAFSFRWMPDSRENADVEALQAMKQLMASRPVLELLGKVTGSVPLAVSQFYLSWFEHGHFLGTHCDPGQSFGVALSLTKEWDPNHGGLTVVLPDGGKEPAACLVPGLFTLLVFDTSARRIPHFVSAVTAPARRRRITAVARYRA